MSEQRVDIVVRVLAPIERVWAVLADARRWREWAPLRTSTLEREGSPDPDGVGAIRRFGRRPVVTREEVVVFEPPHRLVYELRSGLPLRGHRAEVTLTPTKAGGTEIVWHSRFEPRIPGTGVLFRLFLERVLTDIAMRLAARAGRDAP